MSANERHWLLSTLGWKKPLVRIAALRVRLSCTTRDRAWFTMHEWRLPCRNFVYSRLIFFLFFLSFFLSCLLRPWFFFSSNTGAKILFESRSPNDHVAIQWTRRIFRRVPFREFWKYLTENAFAMNSGDEKSGNITKRLSLSLSMIHEIFDDYSTDRDNT